MTYQQKKALYLKYRSLGYSHIDVVRKVLADERLPGLIQALTS